MSYIIDRRLNGKKKSTVNRQRFLKRYKKQIKEAVEESIKQRSIQDLDRGGKITIPRKDTNEPMFHHGQGGKQTRVYPGNKEFTTGDEFQRPQGGGGGGGGGQGQASNQGEGEDDFSFHINQEEFLDFMFEGLELPYLVKKQLKDSTSFETRRAGFTTAGSPDKLNIVRSLRAAHARRIALSGPNRHEIRSLKKRLWDLEEQPSSDARTAEMAEIRDKITELEKSVKKLPFIDEFDLRYNNMVKSPVPSSKAVMFCLMDVSGSMTQSIKEMAKRFFILLYLFLRRNYKHIEVVFIRHHTHAKEVTEEEFFYSRETGGTIVSSALDLTAEILRKRYPRNDWNVYVAQASDGDNWEGDSQRCSDILYKEILREVQYFAYVEITNGPHQNLWEEYLQVYQRHPDQFAIQHIEEMSDIYPVFRKLFERKTEGAA
jgi:uncharacterized sporulation protein YeaH/YhbH (DUF444 family)